MLLFASLRAKARISYDGTNYSGWQRQPNARTVQEEMEKALSKLLQTNVSVMGCGRTDAGVHAKDFILHFDHKDVLSDKLEFRLNQLLPADIAVHEVQETHDEFHARFDAISRTYEYHAHLEKDPFLVDRSLFLWRAPNQKLLHDCCTILKDYSDFASFCKSGADNKTTLCDLHYAEWEFEGSRMKFEIKANRFLRNMVRSIVGTMLEVGIGKRTVGEFREIIEAKDRQRSGKSAAACGLYLSKIEY